MKKLGQLVLLATTIAPSLLLAACGNSTGRWDAIETPTIKIMSSFGTTNNQGKALQNLVDEWNKLESTSSTNPKLNGWRKMELISVSGGYDAIGKNLSTQLVAKDSEKLPNLIIGYPDVLGTIVKYDMQLSLASENSDLNFIRSQFDEKFLQANDEIGGLEKGGFYILPISKSVDMYSINAPVIGYLIDELVKKEWIQMRGANQPNVSATDNEEIAKLWKSAINKPATDAKTTFEWGEILEDSAKLLDFISIVKRAFTSANDDLYVFGLDSAVNFIYQSVYQKVGKMADFIFSKDKNGYMIYNWENKNSEAWKAFKEIYDKMQPLLGKCGIYVKGPDAYATTMEVNHKIAISIGSTAGYPYNYLPGSTFSYNDVKFSDYTQTLVSYINELDDNSSLEIVTKIGEFIKNKLSLNQNFNTTNDLKTYATNNTSAITKFGISSSSQISLVPSSEKAAIILGDYPKYIVSFTSYNDTGRSTLQKEELIIEKIGTAWDGSEMKAMLVQGPSIIGVHNNDPEDKSTQLFVKWLATDYLTSNEVPVEKFASEAGYIVPTIKTLGTKPGNYNSLNEGQKLAWNILNQIHLGAYEPFDNPSDDTTGSFRGILETTIANSARQSQAFSAEEIYEMVKRSF